MDIADAVLDTHVKVVSGPFQGAVGFIRDVQPSCSAVRIETSTGNVYGLFYQLEVLAEHI